MLSPLDKVPKMVFIVGGSIFLMVYSLATIKTKIAPLSLGVFMFYNGIALLWYYRKHKKESWSYTQVRILIGGIGSTLVGSAAIIKYLFSLV